MTDYFLITRFNLPLYKTDKESNPVLTDEWLSDRFRLFETYCIPSVQGQTYKNFKWLVLLSDSTPKQYRDRMSHLATNTDCLTPIYIKEDDAHRHGDIVKEKIKEMKSQSPLLVTMRIDNDDAIRHNFIERITNLAEKQTVARSGYSFVYGMQYHECANLAMRVPYPNNHFIFEINTQYNSDDFDTIIDYNHYFPEKMNFPFHTVKCNDVMWAEVIHGRNVDNDVMGTLRQYPIFSRHLLTKGFGWNRELKWWNTLWQLPKYLLPAAIHHAVVRLKQKTT